MTDRGPHILTRSGRQFFTLDPRPEELSILDIAGSLSKQCRWGGHTSKFYSVAEHSVHVSRLVTPQHALWGLLHDVAEAYLTDLVRPLKKVLTQYAAIEEKLMSCVQEKYYLGPLPDEVTRADNYMLDRERIHLMPSVELSSVHALARQRIAEYVSELQCLPPWRAEAEFLQRFAVLVDEKYSARFL